MEPGKIYESLREKIIWLDLKPESYLNLSELAETFGVSRTPIKEVLILLQAEGWVSRHGSHFMVTPLSLGRIKEITEIRSVMEVQANIWAMERMTTSELAAMKDIEAEILGMNGTPSNRQLVELDVRFHRSLFRATRNRRLAQMLERLLVHYLRFWLSIKREIEPQPFFIETLKIIRAVHLKDETKLRAASEDHIKRSIEEILGDF